MSFYYDDGDRQVGPIGKNELQALIKEKKVNADTLVWQPGMESWQKLGNVVRRREKGSVQTASSSVPVRQAVCSECGKAFIEDEMIQFQDSMVCAACKPLFVQKIKEGVAVAGVLNYAGFWIRFAAFFVDGFIMGIFNLLVLIPLGMLMPASGRDPSATFSVMPLVMLLQYALPAAYDTWFVGKFGATPGKMACKLKVVVADSSRVSYLRAFGRHFAKLLSMVILYVGFILAAFDDDKRTLHDRICETRVIRN